MEKQASEMKLKILTIDDEEQIQYALQAVFQYQGWEAISAGTVEEGLEKFRKYRPDLVLMDYHLPGTNGVKGVELLRREDPDVPLIVFTIADDQQVADAFLDAGANDFILKPIKTLDIISRIKLHVRLLESQRENRNAELAKGIAPGALALLENCLSQAADYLPVEDIAERTGLAYQTTYRYLRYMASVGQVEVSMSYGKVGRPKQRYKLVKPQQKS